MKSLHRLWLIVPIGALVFLCWIHFRHARRVEFVSNEPEWSAVTPQPDPASATGYAEGRRRLLVSGRNSASYQWIAQTQQMFARGEWRVRHVNDENAPYGREVQSASPYRWWLGLVAWCESIITGRSIGLATEAAALLADPILHGLIWVGTTALVAWRFGVFAAILVSISLVGLFPFAANFLPGAPDQINLTNGCILLSLLMLGSGIGARRVINTKTATQGRPSIYYWFFAAGVVGGFGLWVDVATLLPVLVGIGVGAILASVVARPKRGEYHELTAIGPFWRVWAAGGAAASLLGYCIEYIPAKLALPRIEVIHPLFALAWLGGGELLSRLTNWIQRGKFVSNRRQFVVVILAVSAVAILPLAILKNERATGLSGESPAVLHSALKLKIFINHFLPEVDPTATRVSIIGGVTANNIVEWFSREGWTSALTATCLPLLLIGMAIWQLSRRESANDIKRMAIAVTLGPIFIAVTLACLRLRWWGTVDVTLISLLAVSASESLATVPRSWVARGLWVALFVLCITPGFTYIVRTLGNESDQKALTEVELESYMERDLAHWLANRAGPKGAVVLAPPQLSTSLAFHGALSGISTLNWENFDGLMAVSRMVSAISPEEALTLLNGRGVRYIVLPTWDQSLNEYTRIGQGAVGSVRMNTPFIAAIQQWDLPLWLRPVPYPLPKLSAVEESVTIFEIDEEQEPAAATSRLAEYFIEMRRLDLANALEEPLRAYPRNLGALTALGRIQAARHEAEALTNTITELKPILARGGDRSLPWDRRVSLTILLAQKKEYELSRVQLRLCLAAVTEDRLRSLTMGSRFQMQQLGDYFKEEISDRKLSELAHALARDDSTPLIKDKN